MTTADKEVAHKNKKSTKKGKTPDHSAYTSQDVGTAGGKIKGDPGPGKDQYNQTDLHPQSHRTEATTQDRHSK